MLWPPSYFLACTPLENHQQVQSMRQKSLAFLVILHRRYGLPYEMQE